MFSVAVRPSLALILSQVQWWSVSMVSRYDVIRGQAISEWKYMFFQLFSTIKRNLVAKVMQSAYLCVTFHPKHKKWPFLAVLTWFLILGKIQDGNQCWWRHRPPAAPPPIKYASSCRGKSKALHWRYNRFEILQHIKKSRGGSIDFPSPHIRHVQRVITHKILLKIFPKLIEKTILRY